MKGAESWVGPHGMGFTVGRICVRIVGATIRIKKSAAPWESTDPCDVYKQYFEACGMNRRAAHTKARRRTWSNQSSPTAYLCAHTNSLLAECVAIIDMERVGILRLRIEKKNIPPDIISKRFFRFFMSTLPRPNLDE